MLRPIRLADVGTLYLSWLRDPEVTQGLYSGGEKYTRAQLEKYVRSVLADKDALMFAIIERSSRNHIGNIKLDHIQAKHGTAELGVMIGDKACWHRGYGTESCRLLIDYAFKKIGLRKIIVAVFSNNVPSYAMFKKLGFKVEGCLKKHIFYRGKYYDKFFLSLFKKGS